MSRRLHMTMVLVAGLGIATCAYAWTSGPSVTGGGNPMKMFVFQATTVDMATSLKGAMFETPQGRRLVITDMIVNDAIFESNKLSLGNDISCTGRIACVLKNNLPIACDRIHIYSGTAAAHTEVRLQTGVTFDAGDKFELAVAASKGCMFTVAATGYLVRN